ncbi:MAG: TOBE domain-containing protein [bacterium]|nr:TOBE domain-containing protein [bacterium]
MNLKNRLPSIVTAVRKGALNAHIGLKWREISLSVIITSASADEMELREGDNVDVLFKASDVIIAKGLSGKISARNILPGKVKEITEGFPLAMVRLDCKGDKVTAELTLSSLKDMGFKPGDKVDAVIKSSELILAKKKLGRD